MSDAVFGFNTIIPLKKSEILLDRLKQDNSPPFDLDYICQVPFSLKKDITLKYIIETERLLLREITLKDSGDLFILHSDPKVQRYTGEPVVASLDEMERAIRARINNYSKYGYGRWATFLKKDMQFIGWAGLAYLPEFDEIDIGYRFLTEYWGNGLATEASFAILEYGFRKLKLKRIIALAMKDNLASIRVMQKIGMKFYKLAPYEEGSENVVWYCIENDRTPITTERTFLT